MAEQDMSRNEAQPGRALVAAADGPKLSTGRAAPTNAAFITQLLACRAGAPAYRARRRAEPEAAVRSYRAALALVA